MTSTETSPGGAPPAAAPAPTGSSCTISCSGSPEQVAHCMTTTALGGEKSCHANGSPCVGNYFVATGSSESNNSYTTDNAQGCKGQWQFCADSDALRFCPSISAFHANEGSCQDKDIIAYTQAHVAGIKAYVGQSGPGGQNFTLTGLLGVAHLCGEGGMIVWIKTGICPPGGGDAGGTSGTMYYNQFKNTVLPPEISGASASNGAACPGGQGGANPTSAGAGGGTPTASVPSSPVSSGPVSSGPVSSGPASSGSASSGSGSDMMSQMMPMMMMMQMMQMMQQMSSSGGAGSSGSGSSGSGSSSDSPLSSMISQLMSALQSSSGGGGSGSSSSGSGTQQPSPVAQELEQLQTEAAAAQQQAPSSGTSSAAVVSQPDTPVDNDKNDGDYRLSCPHHSADHTLEGCRSYSPTAH